MRKTAHFVVGASAAVLILTAVSVIPMAYAAGQVPDQKLCDDKKSPPKDAVTKGGCVVLDRRKGNCMACHQIAGVPSGNVAPPLVTMKSRFPDKAKLRAQVENADQFKPGTVMPPFGKHEILTKQEIDDLVEFLLTL